MKFQELIDYIKVGREIEFVYNDKHYSITSYEKEWKMYCDDTKEELLNVLKSKDNDLLIEELMNFSIEGRLLKDIFDKEEYDEKGLYIL